MADPTTETAETAPDADEAAGETPVIELTDDLRALRDHLRGAFPSLEASAYRGELTLHAAPEELPALLEFCRTDPAVSCEMLSDLAWVHWPGGIRENNDQETTGWPTFTEVVEEGRIELSYILRSVSLHHWFRVRVAVPDVDPHMPTATTQYASANFMEREAYDLIGVVFDGHPNMTRIMMPEDWDGHPHRKDYPLGGVEVMYKGQTVPPPDEREY